MAKQTINTGTSEGSGDGESIRSAFTKVNANFDELYAGAGGGGNADTGDITFAGTQIIGTGDNTGASSISLVPDPVALATDYPDDFLQVTRDGGYVTITAGELTEHRGSNAYLRLGSNDNFVQVYDNNGNGSEIRFQTTKRDYFSDGDYAAEGVTIPEFYSTQTGYETAIWSTDGDGSPIITFTGVYPTVPGTFVSIFDVVGDFGSGAALQIEPTIATEPMYEIYSLYANVTGNTMVMYVDQAPPAPDTVIERITITSYRYSEKNVVLNEDFNASVGQFSASAQSAVSFSTQEGSVYITSTTSGIQGSAVNNTEYAYTLLNNDFTSASWYSLGLTNYLEYNTANTEMGQLVFEIGDNSETSNIIIFDELSQSTYTLTYGSGAGNLGNGNYRVEVAEAPPGSTDISAITYNIGTRQSSILELAQNIEQSAPGNVVIRSDYYNVSKEWTFKADGTIQFPDNSIQTTSANSLLGNITIAPASTTITTGAGQGVTVEAPLNLGLQTLNANVFVRTSSIGGGAFNYQWVFNNSGMMVFPSASQFQVVAPPASSIGSVGDQVGMVAFSSSFVYYCFNPYDGVNNIWRRVALDNGTW